MDTGAKGVTVADAHPSGKRPFERYNYIEKFITLTQGIVEKNEAKRFIKDVQNLRKMEPKDLLKLNIKVKNKFFSEQKGSIGIF